MRIHLHAILSQIWSHSWLLKQCLTRTEHLHLLIRIWVGGTTGLGLDPNLGLWAQGLGPDLNPGLGARGLGPDPNPKWFNWLAIHFAIICCRRVASQFYMCFCGFTMLLCVSVFFLGHAELNSDTVRFYVAMRRGPCNHNGRWAY